MTYDINLGLSSDLETIASIVGEADIVALQGVGNDWFEGASGNHTVQLSRLSSLGHFRYASALTLRPELTLLRLFLHRLQTKSQAVESLFYRNFH